MGQSKHIQNFALLLDSPQSRLLPKNEKKRIHVSPQTEIIEHYISNFLKL